MNLYKPAERQLQNKHAVLDRVLAGEERNPAAGCRLRRQRRRLPSLLVAPSC